MGSALNKKKNTKIMDILNTLDEDFPSSASTAVEPRKFYQAFLAAEERLASTPESYRDLRKSLLPELTSFLYHEGDSGKKMFRRRDGTPEVLTSLWLSAARQAAGWFATENAVPSFQGFDPSLLADLPRRFKNPVDLLQIRPFLSSYGIIFLRQEQLTSMRLDGAVFPIPSGQIVVALSLRYARLDNFWFTLMHELAHVVLHTNGLVDPIIDDLDTISDDILEKEADRLAADSLIPRHEWRSCPARYYHTEANVINFAQKLGIPAQCVAGRLQRELGRYNLFPKIINKYNTRDIFNEDKI